MNMFQWFRKRKDADSPKNGSISLLIVGLGNPGTKYENTRHNVGFMSVDALAEHGGIPMKKLKFQSLYGEGTLAGHKVLLLKPQTFMNQSGRAVRLAMEFYKLTPGRVLIVYDDVSLATGTLRLRAKGSDGGHNGIKDIVYHLKTDVFLRLKIGVGAPPHPDYKMADWVLSEFTQAEQVVIDDAVKRSVSALASVLTIGIEAGMNRFN